jgi:hypothetical protein
MINHILGAYRCEIVLSKFPKSHEKKGLVNVKIEQVLIMWTNHKGFSTIRSFVVEFFDFCESTAGGILFCFVGGFVTIGSFVVELFLSKYDSWYFHFVGSC